MLILYFYAHLLQLVNIVTALSIVSLIIIEVQVGKLFIYTL